MNQSQDDFEIYRAPAGADALPTERAVPMRWLVVALDLCLGTNVLAQFACVAAFYAFGGSIQRLPDWAWQLARISGYAYYLGCLLFLVFVYRAHRNARSLGVHQLKVSSQRAWVARVAWPTRRLGGSRTESWEQRIPI